MQTISLTPKERDSLSVPEMKSIINEYEFRMNSILTICEGTEKVEKIKVEIRKTRQFIEQFKR